MNTIAKIILFAILIFVNSWMWGQKYETTPNKYNLKINAPDVNQLSKFVSIPSSTYTGTVGVDIPIYNIKIDDYDLPISLKYHTSGIKVKEVASKVGLGWSLSIGNISLAKHIFGNEDRGAIPYINQTEGSFRPNDNSADQHFATQILAFDPFDPENPLGNKRDTEPDIYSYSIPGVSGDYYFDSSGKVVKIPETNVKIDGTSVITDDKGNRYFFTSESRIRTTGGHLPSDDDLVQTASDIKKIILKNGKEIKFEYTSGSYSYLSNYYQEDVYPASSCSNQTIEHNEYASLSNVMKEKYLDKIVYDEGYILFKYKKNREDILDGVSLEKILVYNQTNNLVASYELITNYFTSTNQTKNISVYYNYKNSLTKRLKLSEVKNVLENSSYKLNYYEERPLPDRFSDATDYLGYFNGATGNLGIPYIEMGGKIYGLGDNKIPNINYAVSGSLKEIIYPTGGNMKLEYELDDFYFEGNEKAVSSRGVALYSSNTGGDQKEFVVNTLQPYVQFEFEFNSPFSPADDGSGSLPIGPYFEAQLLDQNNNIIRIFLANGKYNQLIPKKDLYKIKFVKRGAGNLTIGADRPYIIINWWDVKIENKKYNKSIGGIRVKKIVKQDLGKDIIEQNFLYKDENGKSTGVFLGNLNDYYYISTVPNGDMGASCEKMVISNSGNIGLSTVNGKPVVYNEVITERVNISNKNEKWRIVDTYHNGGASNIYDVHEPYQTYDDGQFRKGLLTKKELYNANNILIKKIETNYSEDYYFNQKSNDYLADFPRLTIRPYRIRIKGLRNSGYIGSASLGIIPVLEVSRYHISSAWVKNMGTKITNYFNGIELKEIIDYVYDSNYNHLNPIKEIKTFSDNSIITNTYAYAHEKNNQKLIDANMIGIPLETTTTQTIGNTGKILSKTETRYDSPVHLLPTSVKSYDLQTLTTSYTDVTYDQYDSKGNLLQYTTKDGVPVVIIWGYNQTQPIAKIEGAKFAQINPSLINIIVAKSNADVNASTEQAFIGVLNTFRKDPSLSDYQITTYTYDPLIGVTSITPPSGIREVYKYDTANRLEKVIDVTGKILKEYKYNYKQ